MNVAPEKSKLTAADFRLFVERMWPVVSSDPFQGGYHLDCICEHLQAVADLQIKNLALICPVRHGKSILASRLYPAFLWARNPAERIITATYNQQLTLRDAIGTRTLLESDIYQAYFGKIEFSDDANRKDYYSNTAKGHRLSVSTNSRVAGFDADIIIQDDVINLADRNSEAEREAALDFFNTSLCSRLVKTGKERKVIVGHRYHEEDLFHYLRALYGDDGTWTWCVLPAEYNPKFSTWFNGIGWKDKRAEGESLWPERYGDYAAEKKQHRHEYSAIFGQEPTPKEGTLIKREWFEGQTWDADEPKYNDKGEVVEHNYILKGRYFPKSKAWRIAVCDTAVSTNPEADYTVCQIWDVIGNNFILVDQLRGRFDGTQIVPQLVAFYNVHQPQFLCVEKQFVGAFVLDQLRQHNVLVKAFDAKHFGDKETRAVGLEIRAEARQVWLPSAPWVTDWLTEVCGFPFASHDDVVDAASMACLLTSKYNQAAEVTKTEAELKAEREQVERERFNRLLNAGSEYRRFRG